MSGDAAADPSDGRGLPIGARKASPASRLSREAWAAGERAPRVAGDMGAEAEEERKPREAATSSADGKWMLMRFELRAGCGRGGRWYDCSSRNRANGSTGASSPTPSPATGAEDEKPRNSSQKRSKQCAAISPLQRRRRVARPTHAARLRGTHEQARANATKKHN